MASAPTNPPNQLPTLQQFLTDVGYPDAFPALNSNMVTTCQGLARVKLDTLKTILPPLVAEPIYDGVQKLVNNNATDAGNLGNNENLVLTVYKKEVELQREKDNNKMMKMFSELKHQQELKDAIQAKDTPLKEKEQDATIKLLQREIEFKDREGELKLKFELERMKNELKTDIPSFWNLHWGPYNLYAPIGSVLLTPHYYGILQSCLGSPRVWTLLYRGTRDGWASSTFHALCASRGSTITIMRSTGNYLFGGYNPSSWTNTNAGYQTGPGSWIFTLHNPHGKPPTVFHWKQHYGPYDQVTYGPTFGGGHDIHLTNNNGSGSYSNFPHSYNDTLGHGNNTFTGSRNWTLNEVEVFLV